MMTRAEKLSLDAALRAAAVNRALRWSDSVPVRDLPIPTTAAVDSSGWDFNMHAARGYGNNGLSSSGVFRAWSSCVANGQGAAWSRDHGGTQGGRALYSARALALRGLRAAIEAETAALLADIDAEIEKEARS